jgi:tetratricopeptide (TPR) repeat protein
VLRTAHGIKCSKGGGPERGLDGARASAMRSSGAGWRLVTSKTSYGPEGEHTDTPRSPLAQGFVMLANRASRLRLRGSGEIVAPTLAAAAVLVGVFLGTLTQLRDWDTFHHLAYGRDILRRGGFAAEDPFLFPLAGLPSGPQPSWLGSVLIFLSWRVFGDSGPVLLAAAVSALIFLLLLRDACEEDRSVQGLVLAFVPLSLAFTVFRPRAVARPELFADVLLLVTIAILRKTERGGGTFAAALPFVIVLWGNLHQSVLAGIGLVGVFVLLNATVLTWRWHRNEVRESECSARSVATVAGGMAAGVLLCGALTPVGFQPFVTPVSLVAAWVSPGFASATGGSGLEELMKLAVGELQPTPSYAWKGPFGWLVALAAASTVLAWRRGSAREAVNGAAFVVLAARIVRFGPLACLILAPIAGRNLRYVFGRFVQRPRTRWVWVAGATILAGWAVWTGLDNPWLRFGTDPARHLPRREVAYLEAMGFRGRLFNTFHFGGYLEWYLDRKVFQDGRIYLRPEDAIAAIVGPADRALFAGLDARYRFDALVLTNEAVGPRTRAHLMATAPAEDWSADRAVWALVAFDDGGQLYLRRDGPYAALAAPDEFRFAWPSHPATLPHPNRAGAMRDYERSLREVPGCTSCGLALGFLYLEAGRPLDAQPLFELASAGSPEDRSLALLGAALVAGDRGDLRESETLLRRTLRVAAEPSWPRRELAKVLARAGRLEEALREIRKNLENRSISQEDLTLAIEIARLARDESALREFRARLPRSATRP